MDGWNTILQKSRQHFEEIFDLFSVEAIEKGEVKYYFPIFNSFPSHSHFSISF